MKSLYSKPTDIDFKKDRKISVFTPEQVEIILDQDEEVDAAPVYKQLEEFIDRADEMLEDLKGVCEAFSIPIEEDESQVRAAHKQLGGDGISIKFQEYMEAIDELQAQRGLPGQGRTGALRSFRQLVRRGPYQSHPCGRSHADMGADVFVDPLV